MDPKDKYHYQNFMADPEKALKERDLEIPQDIIEIIRKMIQENPKDRITIEKLKQDPWF